MRLFVAVLLLLGAHFSFTANVPTEAGKAWVFWPFAADTRPVLDLFGGPQSDLIHLLSVVAGAGFLVALLALFGFAVPGSWWMPLVILSSGASLLLFTIYFGPWALLPLAIDLLLLWGVVTQQWSVTNLAGGA